MSNPTAWLIAFLIASNLFFMSKANAIPPRQPKVTPKEPPPLYKFKKKVPVYLKLCNRHFAGGKVELKQLVLIDEKCDACAYIAAQKKGLK